MPTLKSYIKRKMKKYGRKGNRRSRIPRSIRPQMKHYNYTFKLTPQMIVCDNTGPKVLGLPNLPVVPLQPSNLVATACASTLQGYDFVAAATFALSDIASYADFVTMYDAYKINKVTVELEYLSNVSFTGNALGGGSQYLPTFWMYWDQDDGVVPTTLRSILGKQGVRRWQPNASRTSTKFSFRPLNNAATQAQQGASTIAAAIVPNKSNWLNAIAHDVPHNAFKVACTEWPAGALGAGLRLNYTYHVSFRAPLICS